MTRTADSDEAPWLLPTVDPSSPLGRTLRDVIERLRFAQVDGSVRAAAQSILDGRSTARDLLDVPAFSAIVTAAGAELREYEAGLSAADRADFLAELRRPGTPGLEASDV